MARHVCDCARYDGRLRECDAEVFDGIKGALDSHEFIFGRLIGLADALGCA